MNFKTALGEIVKNQASFTLFTAPMGWGKTRLVWELLEENRKIIFICPLRSIVDELSSRENSIALGGGDRSRAIKQFYQQDKSVLVSTVESFPWEQVDNIIEDCNPLFVLDEFHLFYEWGETFRPHLYEMFRYLVLARARIFALTATFEEQVKEKLVNDLKLNDLSSYFIDIGNFQLRTDPSRVFDIRDKKTVEDIFLCHCYLYRRGRILIFVRTRKEAREWKRKLLKMGHSCSICLGGEVRDFIKDEYIDKKRIVIATSALSHGVNLRNIRRVFLTYEPAEFMKAQMIGRGGRFGESFKVYQLANNLIESSFISICLNRVRSFLYQNTVQALGYIF